MKGKETGRAWQPGQSGNPRGRPKSLKAAVQARCGDDGERIVEEIYKIATDRRLRGHNGARVRLQAWTELRDMGWGKPTATLALEGQGAAGIVFGGRFEDRGALVAAATTALPETQQKQDGLDVAGDESDRVPAPNVANGRATVGAETDAGEAADVDEREPDASVWELITEDGGHE